VNSVADFLTEKRAEIDTRLKELRPLYEEYVKLERAKQALDGLDAPRRAQTAQTAQTTVSNGRQRRRRAGGTAAENALAAVRQNPGITVSELAPKLGIKHKNYLYRVMNTLQQDGAVQKQGRGYVAV
jgi:predicted HTH transcriptional regulator